MFRQSSQSLLRSSSSVRCRYATSSSRRFLSTAPPHKKSRSLKSSAARWGIAVAGLWWYNTSPIFAEGPHFSPHSLPTLEQEDENLHTIDELAAARRARQSETGAASQSPASKLDIAEDATSASPPSGAEALEEEADSQGAFNPETGEINWDCPCLGGMAHGPCGPEFREAFSCFVFSKEEPKGMDCVDKFRGMQDCFRLHPDIYGEELADDDEDDPDRVPLDGPSHDDGDEDRQRPVAATSSVDKPSAGAKADKQPSAKVSSPPSSKPDDP